VTDNAKEKGMEPNPYFVVEYESGWYVETADPKDVNKSSNVRGPFLTEADAQRFAYGLWANSAAYEFAAKVGGWK
jgi:hypothetical protein